jgi:hypothetical protein
VSQEPQGRVVVVTGSRNWKDSALIRQALTEAAPVRLLVHGGCRGADAVAEAVAKELGIQTRAVPADWSRGKHAGPERNQRMLCSYEPDLVLAFPLPDSRGTWDCVRKAKALDIPVRVYRSA